MRQTSVANGTMLPLEVLHPGDWAEVAEVTGEAGRVNRMAELGIHVGRRLKMLKPGSPCLLLIDGCRLSLRGDLTMQIMVNPVVV